MDLMSRNPHLLRLTLKENLANFQEVRKVRWTLIQRRNCEDHMHHVRNRMPRRPQYAVHLPQRMVEVDHFLERHMDNSSRTAKSFDGNHCPDTACIHLQLQARRAKSTSFPSQQANYSMWELWGTGVQKILERQVGIPTAVVHVE